MLASTSFFSSLMADSAATAVLVREKNFFDDAPVLIDSLTICLASLGVGPGSSSLAASVSLASESFTPTTSDDALAAGILDAVVDVVAGMGFLVAGTDLLAAGTLAGFRPLARDGVALAFDVTL